MNELGGAVNFVQGAVLGVALILTAYVTVAGFYLVSEQLRCKHYTTSPDWTYESCAKCGSTRSRIFADDGRNAEGLLRRVQVGWGPWKKRKKGKRRGKVRRLG